MHKYDSFHFLRPKVKFFLSQPYSFKRKLVQQQKIKKCFNKKEWNPFYLKKIKINRDKKKSQNKKTAKFISVR